MATLWLPAVVIWSSEAISCMHRWEPWDLEAYRDMAYRIIMKPGRWPRPSTMSTRCSCPTLWVWLAWVSLACRMEGNEGDDLTHLSVVSMIHQCHSNSRRARRARCGFSITRHWQANSRHGEGSCGQGRCLLWSDGADNARPNGSLAVATTVVLIYPCRRHGTRSNP